MSHLDDGYTKKCQAHGCDKQFRTMYKIQKYCSTKCKNRQVVRNYREKNVYPKTRENLNKHQVCKYRFCRSIFPQARKSQIYCSKECYVKDDWEKDTITYTRTNVSRYMKVYGIKSRKQLPYCRLCGLRSVTLKPHIKQYHKMRLNDYYYKFESEKHHVTCKIFSKWRSDVLKEQYEEWKKHNDWEAWEKENEENRKKYFEQMKKDTIERKQKEAEYAKYLEETGEERPNDYYYTPFTKRKG